MIDPAELIELEALGIDRRTTGLHKTLDRRKRQEALLELIEQGVSIEQACNQVGVVRSTYKQWRLRYPTFGSRMDLARSRRDMASGVWNGSHAQFAHLYFGMQYAPFQMDFVRSIEEVPLGGVLMALWPPDHGKTTTAENFISEKLAVQPNWRTTVASESLTIAKKILGRIKNRMEPGGPYPEYVRRWGPFKPPSGKSRDNSTAQPWGADHFNVHKKSTHDERDYSVQALGFRSSIVSTRTDHLHIDDLQSVKTLSQSDVMEEWVRQDALTRPGEHGITTIVGTRVGEDDVYSRLANDEALDGILKVIRYPAIKTDIVTGEQTPLWPERYDLDQLERMKKKAGQDAWDRNYMQQPGASGTNQSFTDKIIDPCKDPMRSLLHEVGREGSKIEPGRVVYVGLDPALGGMNCVIACEVLPEGKLLIRRIREQSNLRSNEQIMQELAAVVNDCNLTGQVSDVIIESMNFQRGLARDERLLDMRKELGFNIREHLTGWNKYDADIGVASMVGSFLRGEIIIPWADDPLTRHEMEELVRQLKAWKPGMKGTKLRQDRVMALWFVWIVWRQRWKSPSAIATNATAFKTKGVPWSRTQAGLIIPVGARL